MSNSSTVESFRDVTDCLRFLVRLTNSKRTVLLTLLCLFNFISLGLYGVIYAFVARRLWIPAGAFFILQYVGYAIYIVFRSVLSPVSLALSVVKTPSTINLFVLGLVAGSLSFGGAYTAIPFIQVEAVLIGG